MRVERKHDGGTSHLASLANERLDQRSMSSMNTVEVAYRHGATTELVGQIVKSAKEIHGNRRSMIG